MKSKKILALFLALCMIFTACGQENTTSGGTDADTQQEERIFDTLTIESVADKLMYIFAMSAKTNWDARNPDRLFDIVNTAVYKSMVERLYQADTGKTFDCDTDGYTPLENYTKYGSLYFDFDREQIADKLKSSMQYREEDDKVFMSDGLGTVIGVKTIALSQQNDNYIIDYIIIEGNTSYGWEYGKLTFTINDDGSFRFISNEYTGTEHTPAYNLHDRKQHPAIATSKDGNYRLYYGPQVNLWGTKMQNVILYNTTDHSCKSLGFVIKNNLTDAGFFSNGDIYTMDMSGLKVYDYNMDNLSPVFATQTNFPAGGDIAYGPYCRYVYAIRRDPVNMDYIAVYSQGASVWEKANWFELDTNYKVGLLDKDGNLTKTIDTGVPVIYNTVSGFRPVYMSRTGDATIEFFAMHGEEELVRVTVNTATEECIVEGEYPQNGEKEKATILAEKYLPKLYTITADSWTSEEKPDNLFAFAAPLELLYAAEHNEKMPMVKIPENDYGIPEAAKVDTYVQVAEKYFGWDKATLEEYFRGSVVYEPTTDTVIHPDGYGWMLQPEIINVEKVLDDLYEIDYQLLYPEGEVCSNCTATARMISTTEEDYLQFISNTVNLRK